MQAGLPTGILIYAENSTGFPVERVRELFRAIHQLNRVTPLPMEALAAE